MSDRTDLDETSLGTVFELLSQASNAGGPPMAAIMAEGQRLHRARRTRQVLAAGATVTALGLGGWLVGQGTAAPSPATPMAVPATSKPSPSPTQSWGNPSYTMYQTFPQWSGTMSGVHWILGLVHAGGGTSCTSLVAGVGTAVGSSMFGCDQAPTLTQSEFGTTGYLIPAASGHGNVGLVTIGQVNSAVKSATCVWKGGHSTVPTFRINSLQQTYFAVAETSPNPVTPQCTLLNAQGNRIGGAVPRN